MTGGAGTLPPGATERYQQMLKANERSAAYYFRCLTAASDAYASQRSELLAAGVSERRVLTLYPTDFGSIAAAIQRHLSRLPSGWLHQGSDDDWSREPNALIRSQTMRHVTQEQRAQFVAAHQENLAALNSEPGLKALKAALIALADRPAIGQLRGAEIYDTLFHAWWLMSHRAEFSANAKETIDMAMIWVAEHVLFDIHLMLEDSLTGT